MFLAPITIHAAIKYTSLAAMTTLASSTVSLRAGSFAPAAGWAGAVPAAGPIVRFT